MDSREAFIALNLMEGVGPIRVRQLLEHFGDAPAILVTVDISLASSGKYIDAYTERANILGALESGESSVSSRLSEVDALAPLIAQRPWFGHGLGATYSFFDPTVRRTVTWSYTHNAYLNLLFKAGFAGGLGFLVLIGAFFKEIHALLRATRERRDAALYAGMILFVIVIAVSSFSAPWLTHYAGTASLGFALGAARSMRLLNADGSANG